MTEITLGIEWYYHDGMAAGMCARCGSSASFVDCYECGGEGFVECDCGDDAMEDMVSVRCGACNGVGGRWHCISSPEFCESHPMPGRELILSTARGEAFWRDAS
jgi:hypothetical protein